MANFSPYVSQYWWPACGLAGHHSPLRQKMHPLEYSYSLAGSGAITFVLVHELPNTAIGTYSRSNK